MPGNVVIMLVFQLHLKELIKVQKVKICRFYFLSFCPACFCDNVKKKMGRSDDAKRRKKGGSPFNIVIWLPQSIKV